ncbi:uncharacterized protein LOC119329784 isoform X2 [Triticum dicoccoides]|uniref:uncharacterized protein LOC119329784 isoform X2 n=1 Tax=Triticum dicoccoides TaxID=85692 RepID=UPI0018916AD1|nr:uncharacterized protein LOC119329784 isoform X2 [Triticum dicoccoides]
MAPQRRAPGDPPPVYGPMEERFSVEINHAGLFCGSGMNKAYFDGRVDHFDGCEESGTTSVGHRKQRTQTTVLETLLLQAQASQQSHVSPGPIPESAFIARNRDALQPTTATTSTVGLKKKQKKRVTKASITEYK